eukprot:TRINITY_DN7264_c0_g1_i2.p1 TRINITY_DN7264_c0_g1~~TRINITY_DN7264_c0_g1_i2.p1  ORF type:complete len:330 (+),score=87.57 TRINITY_DN7264_c0_g1_i2:36-1025(+)
MVAKVDAARLHDALKALGVSTIHFDELSLATDLQTRLAVLTSCMLGLGSEYCGVDVGSLKERVPSSAVQESLAQILLDMGLVPATPGVRSQEPPQLETAMALVAGAHRVAAANMTVFNDLADVLEVMGHTKSTEGLEREYRRAVGIEDVVLRNQAAVFAKGCSILPNTLTVADRARARSSLVGGGGSGLAAMRQQNMLMAGELRKLEAALGIENEPKVPDMTDPEGISQQLAEWNASLASLLRTGDSFIKQVKTLDLPQPVSTPSHDKLGDLATALRPHNASLASLPETTAAIKVMLEDLQQQSNRLRSELQSASRVDVSWAAECVAVL